MEDTDLESLKRRYRHIRAPAYVSTRIAATIGARRKTRGWLPVAAGFAAGLCVVVLALQWLPRDVRVSPTSTTVLSIAAANRQPMPAPTLSAVKSPSLAAMPPAPALKAHAAPEPPMQPGSETTHLQRYEPEENDHA